MTDPRPLIIVGISGGMAPTIDAMREQLDRKHPEYRWLLIANATAVAVAPEPPLKYKPLPDLPITPEPKQGWSFR